MLLHMCAKYVVIIINLLNRWKSKILFLSIILRNSLIFSFHGCLSILCIANPFFHLLSVATYVFHWAANNLGSDALIIQAKSFEFRKYVYLTLFYQYRLRIKWILYLCFYKYNSILFCISLQLIHMYTVIEYQKKLQSNECDIILHYTTLLHASLDSRHAKTAIT